MWNHTWGDRRSRVENILSQLFNELRPAALILLKVPMKIDRIDNEKRAPRKLKTAIEMLNFLAHSGHSENVPRLFSLLD
jgi:hypothetical protein